MRYDDEPWNQRNVMGVEILKVCVLILL
jgi:hypothetical protein